MNKNIFLTATLFLTGTLAFAQEGRVGVNTNTPAATLDVAASPDVATRIDGLIAPRLKGSELKAKDALYTTAQDGTIVYVTEALATSATTAKTTNVTAIGYYYFDKTLNSNSGQWVRITSPYQEPWNIQSTTTPATKNDQEIFQSGSVAVGKNKVVSGAKFDVNGSVRGGSNADGLAVGANSAAFGSGNTASGANSFAGGNGSTSTNASSFAYGNGVNATGNYSTAIGNGVTASGESSFAGGGNSAEAKGVYAFAYGNAAKALSNHAVAMGVGTVAPARSSVTLGRYNINTFTSGNGTLNAISDPIFVVGAGVDDARRYNIITTYLASNGTDPDLPGNLAGWVAIGSPTTTNTTTGMPTGIMPERTETETLKVYGDIKATGTIYAGTNSMADYVFEDYLNGKSELKPSYKFLSLSEVEKYIKTNGHLPGVKSAKEMEDKSGNGYNINLGDLSVQTLEKTEELYLHTIEQQKQIDSLTEKVKMLQEQISQLLSK